MRNDARRAQKHITNKHKHTERYEYCDDQVPPRTKGFNSKATETTSRHQTTNIFFSCWFHRICFRLCPKWMEVVDENREHNYMTMSALPSAEVKENRCFVIPETNATNTNTATTNASTTSSRSFPANAISNPIANAATNHTNDEDEGTARALQLLKSKGTCCFLMKYGVCNPRNPPCRFYHPPEGEVVDDGVSPCAFGLACRQGHAKRCKIRFRSKQEKEAYWNRYYGYDSGESPAVRDATQLQSQLEPWPTSNLRQRLVTDFGESYKAMDLLDRKSLMDKLLQHYEDRANATATANPSDSNHPKLPYRKHISVQGGTPVPPALRASLLEELQQWQRQQGKINTRPSIRATSYLILRAPTPLELEQKQQGTLSRRASKALAKIDRYRSLWDLAQTTIRLVAEHDPEFLQRFSAVAVTYNFVGSPHIDKQNTGPFYGLSLGDFRGVGRNDNGGGCVCVEADAFTVAHVSTHNCLSKCDGRYPHWVSPYEGDRYSLIFYGTSTDDHEYIPPAQAFFGTPVVPGTEPEP